MPTQQKPLEEIAFQIILHSGNARSCAMEGIQLAKAGKFAAQSTVEKPWNCCRVKCSLVRIWPNL
ncbi:hypothetical protein E2L07_20600 [Halalkalibacterium halodurans]|nr:hypothetical protein E2L07_20600 [Halalkalibacterium halodurans]